MPGCCPCCPFCDHREASLYACPSDEGTVRVPCCPNCLPCCLRITQVTVAGGVGACFALGTPTTTFRFDRCFYDPVLNEDVWQWTNLPGQVLVCASFAGWVIEQLYVQCRQHRASQLKRWTMSSPTGATCGGRPGYTIPDLPWFRVSEPQCDPFLLIVRTEIAPGVIECPGLVVTLRIEACGECNGCELIGSPERYQITVSGVRQGPACSQAGACNRYNGTFTLSRVVPGSTELRWFYFDPTPPYCDDSTPGVSWLLRCRPGAGPTAGWWLQPGDATGTSEYFRATSAWSCLGTNVMQWTGPWPTLADERCLGWPSTITVVPV